MREKCRRERGNRQEEAKGRRVGEIKVSLEVSRLDELVC